MLGVGEEGEGAAVEGKGELDLGFFGGAREVGRSGREGRVGHFWGCWGEGEGSGLERRWRWWDVRLVEEVEVEVGWWLWLLV